MVVLRETESVHQAAEAMRDRRIGSVIVTDGHGHVAGILTDRDLVNRVIAEDLPADTPISAVMTRKPLMVDEGAEIDTVIQLMRENGVRRIPVVAQTAPDAMICVGIVTLDDLILSQSVNPAQVRDIVRAQMYRRQPARRFHEETESFFSNVINRVEPAYDLSVAEVEQLSEIILQSFVRRLHHTAAMHLLSQLPQRLQESLRQEISGPDTHVNTISLLNEIMRTFNVDDAKAYGMVTHFCASMELWCDRKVFSHVKAQLPKEFQALFVLRGAERARKFKAA